MKMPWHLSRHCVVKNRNEMVEMSQRTQGASSDFIKFKDENLLDLARDGNSQAQEFLLNKYKPLVKSKSRAFFLMGADKEDIIQEGMIGLYKAVRDYRKEKNVAFHVFAELCINRQIISAVKAATRQKHIPLNSYISLNKPIYQEGDSQATIMDMMQEGEALNPEVVLISQENKNFIQEQMQKGLSKFETKVLMLYLKGESYYEISKKVEKTEKSVDNALQRVKKKMERVLIEKNT